MNIYVFIDWNLWSFPARSAKPFMNIYGFIDWNLWPFPARSANSFMNIYGFIDDNFWPKKARSAKKTKTIYDFIDDHIWPKEKSHWWQEKFLSHLWPFPSAKRKFIHDHLWLHWWSFLTKKKRGAQNQYLIDIFFDQKPAERKTEDHLYHFWQRKTHSSQEFMSNFKSRTKRLPRIQVTVSHNQRLRIPSMQIPQ